jgi:hypothetical protein
MVYANMAINFAM